MKASTRNRLPGTITDLRIDGLMAQVGLKVGDNHIVALISAEGCSGAGAEGRRSGRGDGQGHLRDDRQGRPDGMTPFLRRRPAGEAR